MSKRDVRILLVGDGMYSLLFFFYLNIFNNN